MAKKFNSLRDGDRWQMMVNAATRAVEELGYRLERVPGRGLSNVWHLHRDGQVTVASIRTTRDRWIAFPPLEQGGRWKTLDTADLVVVSAVDSKENPKAIEVYAFPAAEVRERFNAAYRARTNAGLTVRDNFGMWVGLDVDKRDVPASVGSGLADLHKPIARYEIDALLTKAAPPSRTHLERHAETKNNDSGEPSRTTIAEIMASARENIAKLAGVKLESVKLDLKIES